MSFLAEWYDPGLETDPNDTVDSITQAEVARLARQASVAGLALGMPRRLGGEATDEELALDKKRSKRVVHVLMQCLGSWKGNGAPEGPLPMDDGVRMDSAQVVWSDWCESQQTWLRNRIRYVVTWGRANGVDERIVKQMVTRLKNELGWLTYALRD